MKKILMLVCLLSVALSAFAQSKQQKFEQAVSEIMQCLAKDDLQSINKKYIHPGYALFVIYRIGVPNVFYQTQTLEKDSVYSSPYFYIAGLETKKRTLKQGTVDFDCNKEQWTKNGFFYEKSVPHLLSEIVAFMKQYEETETSAETIKTIRFIENNSYKVVDTESDVVFWLSWINNKWYVTAFDLVSMDCSA